MENKITDEMVKEVLEITKKKNISEEEGKKIDTLMELRNKENTLSSSGVDWGQATVDALRRATKQQ